MEAQDGGACTPAARPARPTGRWTPVPVVMLAGIVIAAAVSVSIVHGRSGFFWLVLPALFIARRLICCGGPPRR